MFRITKAEEPSRTTLTIDGQLSADSIAAVETCCNQAGSNGRLVHLYLRDITSVDQAGQTLLSRLAARGVHLAASGVYTSYLVQALTSAEKAPQNSPSENNGVAKAARRTR
jgi:ABC-type transporter Mla MlaB component